MSNFIERSVEAAIHELRDSGMSMNAIARRLEICRGTVARYLRNETSVPECACGRPVDHRGTCDARYAARAASRAAARGEQ